MVDWAKPTLVRGLILNREIGWTALLKSEFVLLAIEHARDTVICNADEILLLQIVITEALFGNDHRAGLFRVELVVAFD